MKPLIIIGGGLAGLVSSILLARKGIPVTLIEKKKYPFHRVCGEYISNETIPFLKSHGLFPEQIAPACLTRFQLSSVSGKTANLPLDLGGFGISRFVFDQFLANEAVRSGVQLLHAEVDAVDFKANSFSVQTASTTLQADLVLGSFGKRSNLDVSWKRSFTTTRSPYVGVKYHLRTDHPADLIALHNFNGGYCGISNIEDGKTNLCYLVHRDKLRAAGSIPALEEQYVKQNPILRDIFTHAQFLFDKPETINEISFATKEPVYHHMLMLGDAAGMITPLCGNGMAMAIRSAKMAAECVEQFCADQLTREELENRYAKQWRNTFSSHLWFGRQVQRLFGSESASRVAISLAINMKWIANQIVRNTHGKPF